LFEINTRDNNIIEVCVLCVCYFFSGDTNVVELYFCYFGSWGTQGFTLFIGNIASFGALFLILTSGLAFYNVILFSLVSLIFLLPIITFNVIGAYYLIFIFQMVWTTKEIVCTTFVTLGLLIWLLICFYRSFSILKDNKITFRQKLLWTGKGNQIFLTFVPVIIVFLFFSLGIIDIIYFT